MISTDFNTSLGLGNQLWRYAVLRVIAMDSGYDFSINNKETFYGTNFINLDYGKEEKGIVRTYTEKHIFHPYYRNSTLHCHNCNISKLDPNLVKIKDNTKLLGIMQGEDYIYHRKKEVLEWFKIKEYPMVFDSDTTCIINFRGGDFKNLPRYIAKEYYLKAAEYMKNKYPGIRFSIVTDDPATANNLFNYEIIGRAKNNLCFEHGLHKNVGDIGIDYSIVNKAKYLIIPNSSFSWWAAWTNPGIKELVAPMYWTAYNFSDGFWSPEDSLTRGWNYMDRNGVVRGYEECLSLKMEYEAKSKLWN